MENAYLRLTIGSLAFAAAAGIIAAGPLGAKGVEQRIERRAGAAMEQSGFHWARIRSEGATLVLHGEAPSDSALQEAIDALTRLNAGNVISKDASVRAPASDITPPPTTSAARTSAESVAQPIDPPGAVAETTQTVVDAPSPSFVIASAPRLKPERVVTRDECRQALRRALTGRRITFRSSSASLNDTDRAVLTALVNEMSHCRGFTINIGGHTDGSGSSRANMRLSERRAQAVADFLGARVSRSTFSVLAYGETRPIASNRTLEGRRANRRIEIWLAD